MSIAKRNYLGIVFSLIFFLLIVRLVQLQLVDGDKYRKVAAENAARNIPAPAARGVIYDRYGEVVVENRPIFAVQVMPQLLTAADPAKRQAILDNLGVLLGEKIEFKITSDKPIIIKDNIKPAIAFQIEERRRELEGVVVSVRPVRYYPHGNVAAHLLGYVGEIDSNDLARLKEQGYRLGDWVGKDGVEKYYDRLIRGIDGGKKIEVDVYGTPTRLLEIAEPVPGADVKLTIDLALQQAAEKALAGQSGGVVVLDPNSGEVLAMVSRPNYDPNLFLEKLDRNLWRQLSGGQHPFMNRALAIYPPGSTFKVVTLTAALQEGAVKPGETFYCPGYYKVNRRIARCWKEGGHGHLTVEEGLTQSCDVVFYELGRRLGPDKLAAYARRYGLGERSGIDLPQEKKGLVPDAAWKKQVWGEQWYEGDSINYGIGQGFVQVTPLQMALLYGELATGKRVRPFTVAQVVNRHGEILFQAKPESLGTPPLAPSDLNLIRQALVAVVDRATGIAAKIPGLTAAGKTGTAENPGLAHAWFVCYAPTVEPQVVIASFVEHGQHGDRAAANVARAILTWYRDHRLGTQEVFDNGPKI
ncbi:MAG: penicillin-binding protein 2 [Candidatus Margulisbacteria bacterium]|jgi:penicillin-binding protein 2|nr:penicillin-binding protein 2 [Candidatus Margulisiibacteriota bacterium]